MSPTSGLCFSWAQFQYKNNLFDYINSYDNNKTSMILHYFLTGIPILVRQHIYTESAQWFFAALHEISSYTGQKYDNNIAIFVFNYFCLNDPSHCSSYVFHNFQTSRNTWKIFQIYTTHQWWYKENCKQIGCCFYSCFHKKFGISFKSLFLVDHLVNWNIWIIRTL